MWVTFDIWEGRRRLKFGTLVLHAAATNTVEFQPPRTKRWRKMEKKSVGSLAKPEWEVKFGILSKLKK